MDASPGKSKEYTEHTEVLQSVVKRLLNMEKFIQAAVQDIQSSLLKLDTRLNSVERQIEQVFSP